MELTKTKIQLINETASKLQIRATGQAVDPEDKNTIEEKIDGLLMQLAAERICELGDENAIPTEWFDPIASLLANRCGPDYGKQFDPGLDMYQKSLLKKIVSGVSTYEPLESEYF